ncbi:regulator [Sulfitobacter sp. NFXS29]|uniref:Rid family detoxifying hydrolase n=1 Tax=Sulfitobacter sp. NFXS29 TaxID=2818438 RepID=UPI0032DF9F1A
MDLEIKTVSGQGVAPAVGPYSHAAIYGDLVFVSGNVALDVNGTLRKGSAAQEARHALTNLRKVLRSAGCDLSDVIKTTIFITDMADYSEVNAVYQEEFESHAPARSCVGVAELPLGARVEIEAIARHRAMQDRTKEDT